MMYAYRKYDAAIETEKQWWDRTRMWKTAYHESGHAWVAARFGWPIKHVTLDKQIHGNPNGNGQVELYSFPAPPAAPILSYVMAGKVCERLVIPNWLWNPSMMGGYHDDFDKGMEYLKNECGITPVGRRGKLLREAEAEVRALVNQPVFRNQIDRLAEALMEARTLTGPQVRAILGLDQGVVLSPDED